MADGTEQMLFIEDCDDAIVGYVHRCGQPIVVVYDYGKLVTSFRKRGMTTVEAEEWVEFNIVGAWVGPGTPAVLMKCGATHVRWLAGEE